MRGDEEIPRDLNFSQINVSQALEDYLEAILELSEETGRVRITDLATKLKVTKASATQAVASLVNLQLAKQERYGPVELTSEGRELAAGVLKKHRIISRFLIEVLQIPSDISERDACLMEHIVSQVTMDKLVKFLEDWVKNSPGKNEGKDENELEVEQQLLTLNDLLPGIKARIVRLTSKGKLRSRMYDMGMVPGVDIQVIGAAPLDDPIEVTIKGYNLTLRRNEAIQVEVEVE